MKNPCRPHFHFNKSVKCKRSRKMTLHKPTDTNADEPSNVSTLPLCTMPLNKKKGHIIAQIRPKPNRYEEAETYEP